MKIYTEQQLNSFDFKKIKQHEKEVDRYGNLIYKILQAKEKEASKTKNKNKNGALKKRANDLIGKSFFVNKDFIRVFLKDGDLIKQIKSSVWAIDSLHIKTYRNNEIDIAMHGQVICKNSKGKEVIAFYTDTEDHVIWRANSFKHFEKNIKQLEKLLVLIEKLPDYRNDLLKALQEDKWVFLEVIKNIYEKTYYQSALNVYKLAKDYAFCEYIVGYFE